MCGLKLPEAAPAGAGSMPVLSASVAPAFKGAWSSVERLSEHFWQVSVEEMNENSI